MKNMRKVQKRTKKKKKKKGNERICIILKSNIESKESHYQHFELGGQ